MTIADIFNKNLRMFDQSHPIYKAMFANPDGTPEIAIIDPNDYNIGAWSNIWEWIRNASLALLTQIDFNQAEGKFLELIGYKNLGFPRWPSESNQDYVTRLQQYILDKKHSKASIIYHTRQFSTTEPELINLSGEAAFSDACFSDYEDNSFLSTFPGEVQLKWFFPAITVDLNNAFFSFILRLTGTAIADIPKLLEVLEIFVSGGINYTIVID